MIGAALAAAPAGAQYVESAASLGLVHETLGGFDVLGIEGVSKTIVDWSQAGVAIGDLDGDGDPDLVACGGLLPNRLLRNDGGSFTDVTATSGLEVGELDRCVALGDYDADGDLDVYLGALEGGMGPLAGGGRSRLYRNDGGLVFTDVTALAGVEGRGHSLFAQWFDLDLDGLLDLYVGEFHVSPNGYLRNNGDGTFSEEGAVVGLDWGGSTHATAIFDANADGAPDVFVGNDWVATKLVGMPGNEGDAQLMGPAGGAGAFVDASVGSGLELKRAIMGLAVADVDYDGDLDLYKTDIGPNSLFLNNGWPESGLSWSERAGPYKIQGGAAPWLDVPGTYGPASGWGALFLDADLDPWLDFFLVNGHVAGWKPGPSPLPRDEQNVFYFGQGPSAGFTFAENTVGAGLFDTIDDRGLAAGDMDLDGDLDLFVTPTAGPLRYFENRFPKADRHWLEVLPRSHSSGSGGIGAVVRWTDANGWVHQRSVGSEGPTASQHEPLAHFGLGAATSVDLEVAFPSGVTLALPGTAADQRLVVDEPELVRLDRRVLPIAGLAGAADPTKVVVHAYAHDAAGQPDASGAGVVIDVPGLTPLTGVVAEGGNAFRREFALATTPGEHVVDVAFGGFQPRVRPRLRFRGAVDPSASVVEVLPEAVRAGSGERCVVTFVPKDPAGLALGSGRGVEIDVASCAARGPVQDLGDGRYRRTFEAPALPGLCAVQVRVDGVALAPTGAVLEAGGAPDPVVTEVQLQVPLLHHAASEDELRVRVRPRDAAGRRLGPGAEVQLVVYATVQAPWWPRPPAATGGPPATATLSSTSLAAGVGSRRPVPPSPPPSATLPPGAASFTLRDDLNPAGQRDGDWLFSIVKDPAYGDALPSGTLVVLVDGRPLTSVPFSY